MPRRAAARQGVYTFCGISSTRDAVPRRHRRGVSYARARGGQVRNLRAAAGRLCPRAGCHPPREAGTVSPTLLSAPRAACRETQRSPDRSSARRGSLRADSLARALRRPIPARHSRSWCRIRSMPARGASPLPAFASAVSPPCGYSTTGTASFRMSRGPKRSRMSLPHRPFAQAQSDPRTAPRADVARSVRDRLARLLANRRRARDALAGRCRRSLGPPDVGGPSELRDRAGSRSLRARAGHVDGSGRAAAAPPGLRHTDWSSGCGLSRRRAAWAAPRPGRGPHRPRPDRARYGTQGSPSRARALYRCATAGAGDAARRRLRPDARRALPRARGQRARVALGLVRRHGRLRRPRRCARRSLPASAVDVRR